MLNPTDFLSQEAYEEALDEAGRGCATNNDALREYARNAGAMAQQSQWILTPWDTWERNPFYAGPEQRHPEDDHYDDEDSAWEAPTQRRTLPTPDAGLYNTSDEVPF